MPCNSEIGSDADALIGQLRCVATRDQSCSVDQSPSSRSAREGGGRAGQTAHALKGYFDIASTAKQIGSDADARIDQNPPVALRDHLSSVDPGTPSQIVRQDDGESVQSAVAQQGHHDDDALAFLIFEIQALWRSRQAWHRAEKSLTLQAKALCRGFTLGDKKEASTLFDAALGKGSHPDAIPALACIAPLTEARDGIEKRRKAIERRLAKLAKQLPVAPWVESVRGASMMSLAAIVGGAGNLSNYPDKAKLWKRMGLAVIDGERQRRVGGEAALAHGYSPSRRSEIWNIGNGLIGGMGHGKRPLVGEDIDLRPDWSPLERLFVTRLRIEVGRDPARARPPTKDGKESFSKHAAARAKRYVEKAFLRQLLAAWKRDICARDVTTCRRPS